MKLLNSGQWLHEAEEKASLETATRGAIVSLGADEGSLLLLSEDAKQLEFVMCCTRTGNNSTLIGQRVPMAEGLVGKAIWTGEAQIDAPIFKNLIQDDFAGHDYGNPSSIIAVPVVCGGIRRGAMTLASFNPDRRFSTEDAAQYSAFATLVGLLLHKQAVIMALSEPQAAI